MNNRTTAALIFCLFLSPAAWAGKLILPDACGDNKTEFNVKTDKNQPTPAVPDAGKAQIVFIENIDKPSGCKMEATGSCNPTLRLGIDGAWVGATKGESYFAVSVDPGMHHLCTNNGKNVGMDSITAEAGKVYYYEATVAIKATRGRYSGFGTGGQIQSGSVTEIDKEFTFGKVSDDEAQYRMKVSAVATGTPKQ
jgi:hypothetical protein